MITINPGLPTETKLIERVRLPSRKALESLWVSERNYAQYLFARLNEALLSVKKLTSIERIINRSRGQSWTCGDGKRVPINEMSDSHLFYALAKARRSEYPDSWSRQVGVQALEGEALRRLAGL